jgi:hypothetical protein
LMSVMNKPICSRARIPPGKCKKARETLRDKKVVREGERERGKEREREREKRGRRERRERERPLSRKSAKVWRWGSRERERVRTREWEVGPRWGGARGGEIEGMYGCRR